MSAPSCTLGKDVREVLEDVLARVQDHPASGIHELLPGAWIAARDEE